MRYGGAPVRESLKEAIETGRRAECQVNVSHLYPAAGDDDNEANVLLEMIDRENERGGDVTFDLTLFTRGGGAWSQSLPGWALEGGLAALSSRVEDPAQRQRLLSEVTELNRSRNWDDDLIVKVSGPESSSLVGRSIGDLARDSGRRPEDTVIDLLQNDPQFWIAPTIKRQADLDLLLQHERCVPVTDGMAAHPHRHAHLGLMPKTFGTFPLLMGDYVRRRGVLGLAEAISRVTSLPADRLGLADRGRLTPGLRADVVVFDPASIDNVATDDSPGEPPVGVRNVMVNGVWALRDGHLTSERSGVVLT
jgi:N-acyl-D-aspartate/D-glutamate deacylase